MPPTVVQLGGSGEAAEDKLPSPPPGYSAAEKYAWYHGFDAGFELAKTEALRHMDLLIEAWTAAVSQ